MKLSYLTFLSLLGFSALANSSDVLVLDLTKANAKQAKSRSYLCGQLSGQLRKMGNKVNHPQLIQLKYSDQVIRELINESEDSKYLGLSEHYFDKEQDAQGKCFEAYQKASSLFSESDNISKVDLGKYGACRIIESSEEDTPPSYKAVGSAYVDIYRGYVSLLSDVVFIIIHDKTSGDLKSIPLYPMEHLTGNSLDKGYVSINGDIIVNDRFEISNESGPVDVPAGSELKIIKTDALNFVGELLPILEDKRGKFFYDTQGIKVPLRFSNGVSDFKVQSGGEVHYSGTITYGNRAALKARVPRGFIISEKRSPSTFGHSIAKKFISENGSTDATILNLAQHATVSAQEFSMGQSICDTEEEAQIIFKGTTSVGPFLNFHGTGNTVTGLKFKLEK